MVKQYKSSSRSKKFSKSKMQSRKNKQSRKTKSRSHSRSMSGGDGRFALPPSYYGKGNSGYYESSNLPSNGNQKAVSQGTIWEGGKYAGPNLYPMLGGDCGCKKRKSKRSKSNKSHVGGFTGHISNTGEHAGTNEHAGTSGHSARQKPKK